MRQICRLLAGPAEQVDITEHLGSQTLLIEIAPVTTGKGKFIGKGGVVIHGIRAIAQQMAYRHGLTVRVDVTGGSQ